MNAFIRKLESFGELNDRDIAALDAVAMKHRTVAARRDLIQEGASPQMFMWFSMEWHADINFCLTANGRFLPIWSRAIFAIFKSSSFGKWTITSQP